MMGYPDLATCYFWIMSVCAFYIKLPFKHIDKVNHIAFDNAGRWYQIFWMFDWTEV